MAGRIAVVDDERLESLRPLIVTRVHELGGVICGEAFFDFFDATMRLLLVDGLKCVGADEGTLWLLDRERSALVPRFNNGPNAEKFVGQFQQSLRAGMISMVVATEQPICENEVHANRAQDKTLDQQLGVRTCAMLATPLYFGGELRGVISAVRLRAAGSSEDESCAFTAENLQTLQFAAGVLSRMIEHRLLALAIGLEDFG